MIDSFQSSWCQVIHAKQQYYSFLWPAIILMGYDDILADLKKQPIDLELQADFPVLPWNIFLSHSAHLFIFPNQLDISQKSFIISQIQCSLITGGRYQKDPLWT